MIDVTTPQTATHRMQRIDVAEVLSSPPPPVRWLLPGFLEFGEVVNLFGRGKAGKSATALALAIAALTGGEFLARKVGQLDWAAYIDAENPLKTIRRRLHRFAVPMEVSGRLLLFSARGLDLGSREGLDELDQALPIGGTGLLILDSAIALHRADENAAVEVRGVVSGVREIVEIRDAATIILGHENRGGDLRGSLDWRNAADGSLQILYDRATKTRTLSCIERRDGDDGEDLSFRFVVSDDGASMSLMAEDAPQPGLSAVDAMAQRIAPLLALNPEISQSQAARALAVSRDNWTFRHGWAVARAAGGDSPGGLGGVSLDTASPPTQPTHTAREGESTGGGDS